MNKLIALATLALAATAAGSAANAHSNGARQTEQVSAIDRGREDGTITWREGIKLRRQQDQIERTKHALESDGRLSKNDRRTLHRLQDESQSSIARESHDGWRRPWWLKRIGL
ncbi:MAG: hypothetical protein ACRCS9_00535 [Hyphomicrobium sp.]